jgi:hypothetical protein
MGETMSLKKVEEKNSNFINAVNTFLQHTGNHEQLEPLNLIMFLLQQGICRLFGGTI